MNEEVTSVGLLHRYMNYANKNIKHD